MNTAYCEGCKREIPTSDARGVAPFFKLLASFSMAAVHGGAWAWTTLSKNYCAACRRRLSMMSVIAATVILSLAGYAFYWVIRKGLLVRH